MNKIHTASIALLALLLAAPFAATAATLSLPARGPYHAGDTFSVPVYVSTAAGETMNAVSGTLHFPPALLRATSITTAGIINLWAQQPAFSNADGTVSFQGVVYNPGFAGTTGRVLSVTFTALAVGNATLAFSDASILANDGQGTDITSGASGTSILIAPATPNAAKISAVPALASVITSSTHPDQSKWYNKTAAALDWKIGAGTIAVRLGYSTDPNAPATVAYTPPISHKEITAVEGVSYFHMQQETKDGWGPVGTFKLQVDTTPPVPMHIVFPHGASTNDPRPIALFNTTDALSGMDHYDVSVAGGGLVALSQDQVGSNPYAVPVQAPGPGILQVIAYDKADNTTAAQADFNVIGLDAPKVDPVSDIQSNQILQISGVTYPSARVDAYLTDASHNTATQWVRTSTNGSFRIIWSTLLSPGTYTLKLQTTDDKGAVSAFSPEMTFRVLPVSLFSLTWAAANYLTLLLLSALVLAVLGWGFWRLYRRSAPVRRVVRMRIKRAQTLLHGQFRELSRAVEDELKSLEHAKSRRELTAEEERLVKRLRRLLDGYEKEMEQSLDAIGE